MPGTIEEKKINLSSPSSSIPTPWNHLEAGILFGLRLPLLIFRQDGISGGVFDDGSTDVFVQTIPVGTWTTEDEKALKEVFLKWHAKVRQHYYS